jgi:hypothetical protein
VGGWHKGLAVSSKGFSLREIRVFAHHQVETLIQRVGSDNFNSVLAKAATIGETA